MMRVQGFPVCPSVGMRGVKWKFRRIQFKCLNVTKVKVKVRVVGHGFNYDFSDVKSSGTGLNFCKQLFKVKHTILFDQYTLKNIQYIHMVYWQSCFVVQLNTTCSFAN